MLFNSLEFLLFFPIVTIVFFLLPHKYRWFHLLVASCIFYMFFVPLYILILFGTIVIDYIAGIMIEKAEGRKRKWYLIMSLVTNIGILAVFKYYNFFAENVADVCHTIGVNANVPLLKMILPIGLSFHTFQAMSYTIEVFWGNQKAEKHFGIYALYVMFYPQLVAGPIERPQNILHQFHEKKTLEYDNVASGIRLMLWGLIKKVVIADRLALYTEKVFTHPHDQSAVALVIGAIFFVYQIFCDFSGYTDIAIGAARVMGFKLMTNFNMPFHSRNIAEFWTRWHISLSTWFKDYVYNPIVFGGERITVQKIYWATMIIFLVSGFWHGANWTFVIWGLVHGFYLVFAMVTKNIRAKVNDTLGISKVPWLDDKLNLVITFGLVVFAGIFFRSNNISDAFFIVKKIAYFPAEVLQVVQTKRLYFLNIPGIYAWVVPGFIAIFLLELAHVIQLRLNLLETFNQRPAYVRWAVYYSGFFLLLFFGVYEKTQFIYFQF
jgi:alginate O-acetyltransferase complex protein AlgI